MATRQPAKTTDKARPPSTEQRADLLSRSQQWSGPLPPPGALQQFNEIIPNGAERIMVMVEREQTHRITHNDRRLSGEIDAAARGHWIGGAITVTAILTAAVGGYMGVNPWICVAIVGLPIATIIKSVFGK